MYYLNTTVPQILFQQTRRNKIYVDKSLMIEKISQHIGTGNKYICITRPRRFGKTVNASMLGAYYTKDLDSRSLFDDLKIAGTKGYLDHLNKHNVVYIDFSRFPDPCGDYNDYLQYVKLRIIKDLQETYCVQREDGMSVNDLLMATGDRFIFILDEWDSIFYESFMTDREKSHFLKFLKGLLKDQPYVELAYMTGVLPIAKYSSGSELNMFREHNFKNDHIYETYFGFTEEEVRQLCREQGGLSYEELEEWYDGYRTSDGRSLFNPRSVNFALSEGVCLNYWTETGPMNEVADCVEHNVDEVREDICPIMMECCGFPTES